jgi:hypothetical protein
LPRALPASVAALTGRCFWPELPTVLPHRHPALQTGSMLVVFGGVLVRDSSTTADVFWLNLERMEWHKQLCRWGR